MLGFEAAWTEYLEKLRSINKRSVVNVLEKNGHSYDGVNTFTIQAPHKVAADMLEDERQDMMLFLRKSTGLLNLNMAIEIMAQAETDITPYTNKEKFESLAKKNPKLMDLKNALDLEIE